ncbi:MAG: hypothetical protein OHK0017_02470 [Patescibacteria group bacterium]
MLKYQQLSPNFHLITNFSKDRFKTEFNLQFTAAGAWFEEDSQRGVSHLLEHCILGRTKDLDFKGLKDYLFKENIYSNAATGIMGMYLTLSGHKSDSDKMLDLILEFGLKPTFSEDIQNQEREIVLREISERRGDPNYRLYWEIAKQAFQPGSRYLCEVLGSAEDVRNSNLETFQAIHHRMLNQSHVVLSVAGGIDDEQRLFDKIKTQSDLFGVNQALPVNYSPENKLHSFKYLPIVSDLAHEHAEITIYLPCPVKMDNRPERYFIQQLLLRHPEGYLYNQLRNELGLIYGLQSAYDQSLQCLIIEMSCEIKYIPQIVDKVKEVFSDFEKVYKPEKAKILKQISVKKQEMSQDEPQAVAEFLVDNLTDFGVPMTFTEYVKQLDKVNDELISDVYHAIQSGLPQIQIVASSNNHELEAVSINL